MNLPERDYKFYAGIDPGNDGAIALMNAAGTSLHVWPMPVHGKPVEYDLPALHQVYKQLKQYPDTYIGIEWPVAWPGAFANVARDAENFGRGKAYLEAFAYLMGFPYCRLAPVLWKGRLGLDGKTTEGSNERAATLFDTFYPRDAGLIRGPRGGLRDGPLDAFLMAHFLRTRGSNGIKSTVATFGKGSPEVMAMMLGGGRRKFKMKALTERSDLTNPTDGV